jgi:hypothetical protein
LIRIYSDGEQSISGVADLSPTTAISLCGFSADLTAAQFLSAQVSADVFLADPSQVLDDERLVVRVNGRYLPRKAALAALMAQLAFQRPLPDVSSICFLLR